MTVRRVPVPFIGGAYEAGSLNFDAQRCVNLYPEMGGPQSKTPAALRGAPGLLLFASILAIGGDGRGLHVTSTGRCFAVVGSSLFEVLANKTVTLRGSLATLFGRVSMADNGQGASGGNQLVIVDGLFGYIFDLVANTLTAIADADFPNGTRRVTFMDGYFAVPAPNSGRYFISDLYDGTAWNALDFEDASGSPDNLNSILANGRDLWLFGDQSTEVAYDSGNPDFPFQRVPGSFSEVGCVAPYSVAKMQGSVYWLGGSKEGNGVVFRSQGYTPIPISNHAIEGDFLRYGAIDDAIGETYQQEGHWFYQLTFPTGNKTWAYDAKTGLWHERAYRDPSTGQFERHRGAAICFFAGRVLVLDHSNGNLYEYSLSTYSDNSDPLVALRTTGHLAFDRRKFIVHAFEIEMETGVGLVTGQGADPQIQLQWSDDGAHTWSNLHDKSIGKIGETTVRVRWRRQGMTRGRCWRILLSDPVKRFFIGAWADVEVLDA
jgi:hypothetical protein